MLGVHMVSHMWLLGGGGRGGGLGWAEVSHVWGQLRRRGDEDRLTKTGHL